MEDFDLSSVEYSFDLDTGDFTVTGAILGAAAPGGFADPLAGFPTDFGDGPDIAGVINRFDSFGWEVGFTQDDDEIVIVGTRPSVVRVYDTVVNFAALGLSLSEYLGFNDGYFETLFASTEEFDYDGSIEEMMAEEEEDPYASQECQDAIAASHEVWLNWELADNLTDSSGVHVANMILFMPQLSEAEAEVREACNGAPTPSPYG